MDKIKTVKIKNEDGSVSEESYSISVDAINVDMSNGKDLQDTVGNIDIDNDGSIANQLNNKININDIIDNLNTEQNNKPLSAKQGYELNVKLNKKPYYFNTVADMKSDTSLKNGDTAITFGYHAVNDGGNTEYKIRLLNNYDVIDEKFIISITNTQLVAELIHDENINLKKIGAWADGVTDDTAVLQSALSQDSINNIYIPANSSILITQDIEIPKKKVLLGSYRTSKIIATQQNPCNLIIKGHTAEQEFDGKIEGVGFYYVGIILGDTIEDFGKSYTIKDCHFFRGAYGILIKNNTWLCLIDNCNIQNVTRGIKADFENVINSGAAIKITNCNIYNCNYAFWISGAALDGYNILINNCDFEHNDYSIYALNGKGNNIQISNFHVEGNRIGSIYTETTNVYINNIWDFDSNPETYIAKYTVINNGRIFIYSGRINYVDNKLAKNIGGVIYIDTNRVVMPTFLYNKQILTDDSTKGIIVPDGTIYPIPTSVATKIYSSTQVADLTTIEKGSNNGCIIDMILRQKDSASSENTPSLSVFMSSTTGTKGIAIPLVKDNCNIHLIIEYKEHILRAYCSYLIDGQTISNIFEREEYFTSDTITASKTIQLRYNYGIGTLTTNSIKATALNGYFIV